MHEAGLSLCKLGFKQAIVPLEEGRGRFSNIDGVNDIRFSKGKIMAASEHIRNVIEREGLLADQRNAGRTHPAGQVE
jgi:hypothetical protein